MRKGCSPVLFFLCLAGAFGAILAWSLYLDAAGALVPGTVDVKAESIRVHYGDWSRTLEVAAAYQPAGELLRYRAGCEVDEETYDSLHVGSPVMVRSLPLPSLRSQPFLPVARLSACTTYAAIHRRVPAVRKVCAWLAVFAALIFLWRVLRIRLAGWLLLPAAGLLFAYVSLPRVEPAPSHPRPATATVQSLTTVTALLESDDRQGIDLAHPYQLVALRFIPSGRSDSVVAVDSIDLGSVSGLAKGAAVAILYDPEHPRIARIQGATRHFPEQAIITVALWSLAFVALLVLCWLVYRVFHFLAAIPWFAAARQAAAERRARRRARP
jgi:hypothetical protein